MCCFISPKTAITIHRHVIATPVVVVAILDKLVVLNFPCVFTIEPNKQVGL